jgi:hypothetical protein
MGQGYWSPPPSWGSPPRGQALPPPPRESPPRGQVLLPFGSPLLGTSPLRPTTSTPPTVCLLDYFAFLRRPFHVANTSIYMSFRAAQDHNKAACRDMTLSMASSTWREDPTATTCHRSSVLLLLVKVAILVSLVVNYSLKVGELVSVLLVVNYVLDLMMCMILLLCIIYHVYSVCFGGSRPGRQPKQAMIKK